MSALVQRDQTALAPVSEQEVLEVLKNSLYPGAADASIKLVVAYCRAAGLDVMQKPVHIVQVWDSKAKQLRDTVMPGIGLYRTQAARTGQYAGISEPVFGPPRTFTGQHVRTVWEEDAQGKRKPREVVSDVITTYPEWCRVVVKRMLPNGTIAEFPALEYWLENYATASKDSDAPNAMWQRRPFAQLAKCAEAQALRKAFPELGAMPTAEEMEGKEIGERDITPPTVTATVVDPAAQADAKRRAELVSSLEAAAAAGLKTLGELWKSLPDADRNLVGPTEWERIKTLVPKRPKADEADGKPTYAQIMQSINEAADVAALSEALGIDMTHLNEQMRAELLAAGQAKAAKFEGAVS